MAVNPARTDRTLATRLAAIASFGAAVIHGAVVPTHWHEWRLAGVFFVALGLAQLLWAIAVLGRPTRLLLAAGIVLNISAIALWSLSRTVGAPLGPHAGVAETVGAADLCALLLQIYVVMGAGWAWRRNRRSAPIPGLAHGAIVLSAGAVVALASTVGVATGLRHGDHGSEGTDHHRPVTAHQHAPAAPEHVPAPENQVSQLKAVPPQPVTASDGHGDHHHGG